MFESIKKWLASVAGQPFLYVEMKTSNSGELDVNTMFNKHLIDHLDKLYKKNGYPYDDEAPDDGKVVIFIADCFSDQAAEYLPPPDLEDEVLQDDFLAGIPPLTFRGGTAGQEVRQVVDLADRKPGDSEQTIDIMK